MITIQSPLFVYLPRKTKPPRKCFINLNSYRNWHYQVSNNVKKEYADAISQQLDGLRFTSPITLSFVLYKKNKQVTDRANILSITEKFFCDALVEHGCIPDDNDKYILSTHYSTGGIDKEKPRVEITIEALDKCKE